MKKDRKTLILVWLTALALGLSVIGATFAYLRAKVGKSASIDIEGTTGTTDALTFMAGNGITLKANFNNFEENMGNLKGNTTATAMLRANNTTNAALNSYNIFFIIDENSFVYSTGAETRTPEILLRVKDPNGNAVESITGLKKVTGEVNGLDNASEYFDITTKSGAYLVRSDYEIKATGNELTTQEWTVDVVLVNLEIDQEANEGKTLNGRFYVTPDKLSNAEPSKVVSVGTATTYNSVTTTANMELGVFAIDKYYFAIKDANDNTITSENADYVATDDSSYTFRDLEAGKEYVTYAYAVDVQGFETNRVVSEVTELAEYVSSEVTGISSYEANLNSISIKRLSINEGTNKIAKYYYQISLGEVADPESGEWSEGQSNAPTSENPYIFNSLQDTSQYHVYIKVEDTDGRTTIFHTTVNTKDYELPRITGVTPTTTYNSISVTTNTTKGINEVNSSEYYYSISSDDGDNWSEWNQSSNTYTFTGLNENASYLVKVKVKDTNDRESIVFTTETIRTDAYNYPEIKSVQVSEITTNSFKVTVDAEAKQNGATITSYQFSKDNGSNWTEVQAGNTYTFSGLTSNSIFPVLVKVIDSNGKETIGGPTSNPTTDYENPKVTALTIGESSITSSGFTVIATVTTGSVPIQSYYFSVSTDKETWTNESEAQTTNSYIFTDLEASTEYYVKVRVVDINNKETSYTTSIATSTIAKPTFATYIKSLYTTDGENNLYYHDGSGSYENAELEAEDNSYRFAGSRGSTNNYVCFGSTDETCPTDNLYRIIGVFGDRVKLIKSDYADSTLLGTDGDYSDVTSKSSTSKSSLSQRFNYYWNNASGTNENTWSDSQLNKINLNTNYINNIGSEWANLIDTTTWNAGGMTEGNGRGTNAKTAYNYEVGANKINTPYSAKIGLMYLSDYYYAASPIYWSYQGTGTQGYDYQAAVNDNWIYMGEVEWGISYRLEYLNYVFDVGSNGAIGSVACGRSFAVRPSFYLKSDISAKSGNGSANSPYRLM
ncbi:MAG: fibronectin type III domain-containing protein [Bacilli bacterium]|nr:fibronectin type III domain-containing protein [Bacilli bacterium]